MDKERILEDEELGQLLVRVNARARRLTFRAAEEGFRVTVPPRTSLAELKNAIEQLRPRLRVAKQKQGRKPIDLDYRIETELFKLTLTCGQGDRFFARSEQGRMEIVCPQETDFADEHLQAWLRKVVDEALRRNAKSILPPRLRDLSERHGLPYQSVKINSSRGRWGSCSVRGSICLSCHLLLLPPHLIDYVMLHELAHTREMNHGERFWALLNQLTNGKAQSLRKELRNFRL